MVKLADCLVIFLVWLKLTLTQLPTLGVGLSLSLASKPDPVALATHPQGASFIEYAGLVDVDSVLPQVKRILIREAPTRIWQGGQ